MLLSDRPADQPLINAALVAVAKQGYVTSAVRLKSKLLEVLVSDNPAASGSVIVTLQASRTAWDLDAPRPTRQSRLSRRNGRTWTTCGMGEPIP